jgi:MFS family permease
VRSRLIPLLCLTGAASTLPVGVFPALLPDLDRVAGLSDMEIGALSGAFGFARMLVDIPVGLFVARRPRWALLFSPGLLAIGILTLASGGPFGALLGGRVLMGVAHSLGMVAWLTTILRHQQSGRVGASLNAFELSAMLGMLGGITLIGAMPTSIGWNIALLIACTPQVIAILAAPALAKAVSSGGATTPLAEPEARSPETSAPGITPLVALAFIAGAVLATTYSTAELFMLPLRGSRELGLERAGVARMLMIATTVDILALLPVGFLADRVGATRLLGLVVLSMATSAALIGFGGLGAVAVGAAFMGLAMAGWMLPLAVLRSETPPSQVAWRTALYRVGVDGGLFAGPFLAGLLGRYVAGLPVALAAILVTLGLLCFVSARR